MKWLVRLIERWTGIDAVHYWRDRHDATLQLLGSIRAEAQGQIEGGADALRKLTEEYTRQNRELIEARVKLRVEQNIAQTLQNLVQEIGDQAEVNKDVAPKTMLGVFEVICHEALVTIASWRQTGVADAAEIVNVRATLANRLLPDVKPSVGPFKDVLKTERKRDGRAGDTATRPNPAFPHRYEYDLFAADYGMVQANAKGESCNLCRKPMTDPIHLDVHVKTSGTITAEKRPDDTPPQTVPAARHFYSHSTEIMGCDHVVGHFGNGAPIICGKQSSDPIHIVTAEAFD